MSSLITPPVFQSSAIQRAYLESLMNLPGQDDPYIQALIHSAQQSLQNSLELEAADHKLPD